MAQAFRPIAGLKPRATFGFLRGGVVDQATILAQLTVDGNTGLNHVVTKIGDNDQVLGDLIHEFLTEPFVIITTGNAIQVPGTSNPTLFYYKAAFVPILKDTDLVTSNGSPLKVRTVKIDTGWRLASYRPAKGGLSNLLSRKKPYARPDVRLEPLRVITFSMPPAACPYSALNELVSTWNS